MQGGKKTTHKRNFRPNAGKNPVNTYCCCCSVTESCPIFCNPMDCSTPRFPCPSLFPRVCSNSCPLSQWCHPTILSSVTPSPPAPNLSQHQGLFQWVGSLHHVAKVLELQLQHPMNIQGWFPLGLTNLISLQSKGLTRVFSNTTVWKHRFFGAQLSLWSNYYEVSGLFWWTMLVYVLLLAFWGFPSGSAVKNLPAMQETQKIQIRSLGQ